MYCTLGIIAVLSRAPLKDPLDQAFQRGLAPRRPTGNSKLDQTPIPLTTRRTIGLLSGNGRSVFSGPSPQPELETNGTFPNDHEWVWGTRQRGGLEHSETRSVEEQGAKRRSKGPDERQRGGVTEGAQRPREWCRLCRPKRY